MIIWTQIKNKINLWKFKKEWRSINKHNETSVLSIFPISQVIVGNHSYGTISIQTFLNENEKLIVGNFVSIANNVTFILGGNHSINSFSPYPLYSKFIYLNPALDAKTKGSIIIEDEVWIGFGAIIMSGIKVGRGAIIAAAAVVTKDVPPYSIVAGNPAKIIKYRFKENLSTLLSDLRLSDFNEKQIKNNINLFYDDLTVEVINKLKMIKNEI